MPNANDGQDILAMSYDPYNFKLVTLTEDYVKLILLKNAYSIFNIYFFNLQDNSLEFS